MKVVGYGRSRILIPASPIPPRRNWIFLVLFDPRGSKLIRSVGSYVTGTDAISAGEAT
jgi:hypothetical protein